MDLDLAGTPRREIGARAAEPLARLRIGRYRDFCLGRLPGGERAER